MNKILHVDEEQLRVLLAHAATALSGQPLTVAEAYGFELLAAKMVEVGYVEHEVVLDSEAGETAAYYVGGKREMAYDEYAVSDHVLRRLGVVQSNGNLFAGGTSYEDIPYEINDVVRED